MILTRPYFSKVLRQLESDLAKAEKARESLVVSTSEPTESAEGE